MKTAFQRDYPPAYVIACTALFNRETLECYESVDRDDGTYRVAVISAQLKELKHGLYNELFLVCHTDIASESRDDYFVEDAIYILMRIPLPGGEFIGDEKLLIGPDIEAFYKRPDGAQALKGTKLVITLHHEGHKAQSVRIERVLGDAENWSAQEIADYVSKDRAITDFHNERRKHLAAPRSCWKFMRMKG